MRRELLLANDIRRGPHGFVLDLGSGRSPLLRHLEPERYVGIDLGGADLTYARKRYARPNCEFLEGDIRDFPLGRWRGADVVTASAVFHHLTDAEVQSLVGRVADEVRPGRMVYTDGLTIGPLSGVLTRLDGGEPTRAREALYALFHPRFTVREAWSYTVPFRTYFSFGFELTPRA